MRIESVMAGRITVPLHRPFVTAVRRTDHAESVLVQVRDADGRCGWGEAAHNPRVTGETSAGVIAAIDAGLRDAVLGREPLDLAGTCRAIASAVHGNTSAKAALDVAVHDLAARQLGVPLRVLLGGTRSTISTDVTLSIGDPDVLGEEAARRRSEGFDVLKVKLDGHDDLQRLRAIRDGAGPGVRMRVDANQAWTPQEAIRLITAMEDEDLPVELVEQPVPASDLRGLARVTQQVMTPILADESVRTASDVIEIARLGAADLVNLKLAKCGGLGPARAFLSVAEACGLGVVIGSMLESHVACGAAAHLAATCDYVPDLDPPYLLRHSPVAGGIRTDGPSIVLPDTPGSGIERLADAG
ncbi:MAG: dipeptide epimerase [Nocardiopsaceae bacterium]|nr:dipeptide epimerase [Nocardiopsaceae bacterium]